jgi:hypothetical protein
VCAAIALLFAAFAIATEKPVIDHGYLSDPEGRDLAALIDGFKVVRTLVDHDAFRVEGAKEILDSTIPHPPESEVCLCLVLPHPRCGCGPLDLS